MDNRNNWSDFEKYVIEKLDALTIKVENLRGRATFAGALAGILGSGICLAIFEFMFKTVEK